MRRVLLIVCASFLLLSCREARMMAYSLSRWDEYLFGGGNNPHANQGEPEPPARKEPAGSHDPSLAEEEQAVRLLNDIRAEKGLPPLNFDAGSALQRAARTRAREISDYGCVSVGALFRWLCRFAGHEWQGRSRDSG